MTVKYVVTPILSNITQRTTVSLSRLFADILSQVTGDLSRKDVNSCALLSKSLRQSFAPRLWKDLDPFRCYPRRASLSRLSRFDFFKSFSIDTGAFLKSGQFIQSLKGVYVEWLAFSPPLACSKLTELDVAGYAHSSREKLNPVSAEAISSLSKTLCLFFQSQARFGF